MVYTILIVIFLALYTLVMFVAVCVVWVLTVWWDGPRRAIHVISSAWSTGYFRIVPGWRVEVEGEADRRRTYVVVSNHRSMIDIVLLHVLPIGNFRWVSKREVYRWPLFGWALRMRGDVTIERGTPAGMRKMMRRGVGLLRRGVSIMVFPEGTRSHGEGMGRFHDGAFRLAREAGVEVLPVVVSGTDTVFVGRRLNRRNVFTVRILPPMEPDKDSVKEAMARARAERLPAGTGAV